MTSGTCVRSACPTYAARVSENALDRTRDAVGLLAYVVVGLMTIPTGLAGRLSGWWWISLAVGLLLFGVLCSDRVSRSAPRRTRSRWPADRSPQRPRTAEPAHSALPTWTPDPNTGRRTAGVPQRG